MHRINLKALKEISKNKPTGYYEDVMSKGVVKGEWLYIHMKDYIALRRKYNSPQKIMGVGSAIEKVAKPIAKMIDKLSGGRTHLETCGGCQKRKEWLDEHLPL